jgi:PelA/Pel-15E family pectate lyase
MVTGVYFVRRIFRTEDDSPEGEGSDMMRRPSLMLAAALLLATPACASAPAASQATAPAAAPVEWDANILRRDPAWFASAEALGVADTVLTYQSAEGAWPKNRSLAVPLTGVIEPNSTNTIDNQATTVPLAFLARVISAGGGTSAQQAAWRAAFDRGLDWLLAAQYPNGGWPQFYPLRTGYYDHITFNDDAMARTLNLLREIESGRGVYGFVDAARRERARAATQKGLDVILRTQIRKDGVLTVWCAQHDEKTLEPAWARRFEPPSYSGGESVGIVRYLMSLPDPSPEVIASIEAAVVWFRAHALTGIRIESFTDAEGHRDRRVVADASAPPIWARFYSLETGRPVFMGRESVARDTLAEIERERRGGYSYYVDTPGRLLENDYPAWCRRIGRPL